MRALLLLLCVSACGLTRIESLDSEDATLTDATSLSDSRGDVGAPPDAPLLDAPPLDSTAMEDALVRDVPTMDANLGNCTPITESACPNESTTLELGVPYEVNGALVQGQANDVASGCGGGQASDWSIAVTAATDGLFEYRFRSAVNYALELRDGGCDGPLLSCNRSTNTQNANGIAAGQTYLFIVHAADACDVPFELTMTLLPI